MAERVDFLDVDARQFGIDQEQGDAFLLLLATACAGDQQTIVADVHAGGEDLLAVDDVVVAVRLGGSFERRRIRARVRFGEAKADADIATSDPGQNLRLHLVRAVGGDRIAAPNAGAEHPHGQFFILPANFFQDDGHVRRRAADAAMFFRQQDAEPSLFRHGPVGFHRRAWGGITFLHILRRAHILHQFADLAAQNFLFFGKTEIHLTLPDFFLKCCSKPGESTHIRGYAAGNPFVPLAGVA